MLEIITLSQVKRIHVRAQCDFTITATLALEDAHHPGLGQAAMHLDPEGFKTLGDET